VVITHLGMTKGKIAAQWVPSNLPLVNDCLLSTSQMQVRLRIRVCARHLVKSYSHPTLACYKALSKANPAVGPSNWATLFRTEACVVGEALGEIWTSKNRRSTQIRGAIAPITSHRPKSESCGPINPGCVRNSVPRSAIHVY
jgi:hypothetical protein